MQNNYKSQVDSCQHNTAGFMTNQNTRSQKCNICASLQKPTNQVGNSKDHLENSCVTFQYYNSSKFASNSTNQDARANGQNAQNYFYFTKTTNRTNQSGANQSGHCNTHGYNTKQTEGNERSGMMPVANIQFNVNGFEPFEDQNGMR